MNGNIRHVNRVRKTYFLKNCHGSWNSPSIVIVLKGRTHSCNYLHLHNPRQHLRPRCRWILIFLDFSVFSVWQQLADELYKKKKKSDQFQFHPLRQGNLHLPSMICIFSSSVVRSSANITSSASRIELHNNSEMLVF